MSDLTLNKTPEDVISTFEIPEELAKNLSELLTMSSIRRSLLIELVGKQAKYEEIEKTLIPIENKIDAIKTIITNEYVPDNYRSEQYQWVFPGFEITRNVCWIRKG